MPPVNMGRIVDPFLRDIPNLNISIVRCNPIMLITVNAGLDPRGLPWMKSQAEVLSKPVDLMHPFMQYRDNADILIREPAPQAKWYS